MPIDDDAGPKETKVADDNDAQAAQMPTPDPALEELDRFAGTWEVSGRTLGADTDNVSGRLHFEWLPGGWFLKQQSALDFLGMKIESVEIIGYDPERGVYPSTVYANLSGVPLPYEYRIDGNQVTIRTEFAGGSTYNGTFGDDGNSMAGGWRPDEGNDNPGSVAYDISGTRVE